jgi:peptidoglycan/xylan/chitin deacetylase (PgdA/CDA1 family)
MTTRLDEPGTCVVTFDDGYQNNLTNAAQELSSRKISGLFFVPACYFDGIRILWVDKVLMWLSYVPPGRYHILGADREVSVAAESRRALWEDIYKALLDEYSLKERLLGELDAAYSFAALLGSFPPKMYAERFTGMTAEDVAELAAMGHKTACHSYRHDILSRLDAAALKLDFRSCATHADKYNTKLYSYPFGGPNEISPAVIEACGRHDFDAAFMNYDTDNPGKLTISRISLDNLSDRYVIHARLSGFESFIKKMLRRRAL